VKTKEMDLTKGSVVKNLLLFSLPLLGSCFFQQFYSTVDAIIVGKYVGKTGLASIDAVFNFLKLPTLFFIGISMGATIIISQYFGAKRKEEMSDVVHTILAFSLISGIIASLTGMFFVSYGLCLLHIPRDIYAMTLAYVQIRFCGLATSLLFNVAAGILRAVGDSQTPFYIMGFACVGNIVLDLLFVGHLQWGVAGAAWATLLVQLLATLYILFVLARNKGTVSLEICKLKIHLDKLEKIVRLGIPLALQSAVYPFANMIIQSRINCTGTDNIAAYALCGKLDFVIWPTVESLGMAVSTLVAQNYGANLYVRVRSGMKAGLGLTGMIIIIIDMILFTWCEPIGKVFLNAHDHDIVPLTAHILRFLLPFNILFVISEVISSTIRGMGETFRPMVMTLICTCGVRVLWVLFMVPTDSKLLTILGCYPLSWLLVTIAMVIFYRRFLLQKM
jgi:putative MATE family efflux protein